MKTVSKVLSKVTVTLSIGIYIVALTQKCYCTIASCGDSIMALIFGAIGAVFGGAALTWVANPLLLASWFLMKKNLKLSLFFSLTSLLISISFLFFKKVISDEAGNFSQIISYELGYWLWVLSSFVMFLGNLLSYFFYSKISHQNGILSYQVPDDEVGR